MEAMTARSRPALVSAVMRFLFGDFEEMRDLDGSGEHHDVDGYRARVGGRLRGKVPVSSGSAH